MQQPAAKSPKASKAWWFIVAATTLLLLFVINGMMFDGGSTVKALSAGTFGIVLSFLFAAGALGSAIAANASAYLNPNSTVAARAVSPPLIIAVFILVLPFFITVGLSMVN